MGPMPTIPSKTTLRTTPGFVLAPTYLSCQAVPGSTRHQTTAPAQAKAGFAGQRLVVAAPKDPVVRSRASHGIANSGGHFSKVPGGRSGLPTPC